MKDEGRIPPMNEERARALRALVLEHVRDTPERRRQTIRRRTLTWGVLGVVALGGAGVAAAAVVDARSVTNSAYVTCMAAPERGPNGSYPGATATVAHDNGPGRIDDAISVCQDIWREGTLDEDYDPLSVTNEPGSVPADLQVCVMRDGSAAVVPTANENICDALGLAPLVP